MKILVVNFPAYGHNIPTVGFIKELINRKVDVDVILSKQIYLNTIINEVISSTGANIIICDEIEEDKEIYKRHPLGRLAASICMTAYTYIKKSKYDAIVYDFFLFPVFYYAELVGIPAIRFFSSWAYNKDLYNHMFEEKEKDLIQNKWFVEIVNTFMNILEKEENKFNKKSIKAEIIDNVPPLNIVGVMKELQPCAVDFDERYVFVGMTITKIKSDLSIHYDKSNNKKIVYVSFGTMVNVIEPDHGKELFEKIMMAFKDENVQVIMSVGLGLSIDELSSIPSNFSVYQYVPQTEILSNADLFITHGGMNSINESIYFGVPMIALPGGHDQFANAEQIENKKIGYYLERKSFTSNQLKKLAKDILFKDDEIKSNIKYMQGKLRSIDSSVKIANLIINYITKNTSFK
ncbi:MAG: hypothetical protein FWG91_06525 [Lachnospiraceae bacterium]|nr:hypothetical protein [Lachnospiraceae bacterium]